MSSSAPGWLIVFLGVAAQAQPQTPDKNGTIDVSTHTSRAVTAGPARNFTGTAQVEQLFAAQGARVISGGIVTFEPGARSAWHTHPRGQVLIITAGTGWVQMWGHPAQRINAGDVVWIPPGIKHWHGAGARASMSHIAIQEPVDADAVDWLEPVSDSQYQRAATNDLP